MKMLLKIYAWLTKTPLVVLTDYDGEETLAPVYVDSSGRLAAKRYWPHDIRNAVLNPDGTVSNGFYVIRWRWK